MEVSYKDALTLGADIFYTYAMGYIGKEMSGKYNQQFIDLMINFLMSVAVITQDRIADDTWQSYYMETSMIKP